MNKILKKVAFQGGLTVLTSDAKLLEWCMREAGHVVEEQSAPSWRVVLNGSRVFAVTDTKSGAEAVRDALHKVGIQGSVHIEPNE